MSSTLHTSTTALLASWLNIIFSFARSSRIQFLFEPLLISSIAFVFVSVISSFTTSFCKSAFVLTSLSPRWVSTSMFEVVCPSFLESRSVCVELSVTYCAPAWNSTRSPFREVTRSSHTINQCHLQVSLRRLRLQVTPSARIAILDLALLIIVPN